MDHSQSELLTGDAAAAVNVSCARDLGEFLAPRKRNRLDMTITRADGRVEVLAPAFNSRTAAGALWQAQLMGSAAGVPAMYMALTSVSPTIANADTTLASEIVANGCARALASYGGFTAQASLGGTASFTLTKLFTCVTASQTVNGAALFTASSAGTMFVEASLTTATLQVNDTLNVVWTITI